MARSVSPSLSLCRLLWVAAARRKVSAGTLEVSELATIYKQMYEAEGKKISKEQVPVLYWSAEQAEGVVVDADTTRNRESSQTN